MKKLLNGILLCSLALAPGFASPLSRFNQLFAKDILALHTTISLDPSVTVQDDGRGSLWARAKVPKREGRDGRRASDPVRSPPRSRPRRRPPPAGADAGRPSGGGLPLHGRERADHDL